MSLKRQSVQRTGRNTLNPEDVLSIMRLDNTEGIERQCVFTSKRCFPDATPALASQLCHQRFSWTTNVILMVMRRHRFNRPWDHRLASVLLGSHCVRPGRTTYDVRSRVYDATNAILDSYPGTVGVLRRVVNSFPA
jgi:hypothetical protein